VLTNSWWPDDQAYFPERDPARWIKPNSAALYLRVSTGRQATSDVSLPSQRDVTRSHCETNGWIVVEEYVEAATATDDRRPLSSK